MSACFIVAKVNGSAYLAAFSLLREDQIRLFVSKRMNNATRGKVPVNPTNQSTVMGRRSYIHTGPSTDQARKQINRSFSPSPFPTVLPPSYIPPPPNPTTASPSAVQSLPGQLLICISPLLTGMPHVLWQLSISLSL